MVTVFGNFTLYLLLIVLSVNNLNIKELISGFFVGLIWIQNVCQSDGIPEKYLLKRIF